MLGLIQFVQKLGFNMGIIILQVLSHLPSMLIKVKTLSTQQALSCSMSTAILQYFWLWADKYKWATLIYLEILLGVIQKVRHPQNSVFDRPPPYVTLSHFFLEPPSPCIIH